MFGVGEHEDSVSAVSDSNFLTFRWFEQAPCTTVPPPGIENDLICYCIRDKGLFVDRLQGVAHDYED